MDTQQKKTAVLNSRLKRISDRKDAFKQDRFLADVINSSVFLSLYLFMWKLACDKGLKTTERSSALFDNTVYVLLQSQTSSRISWVEGKHSSSACRICLSKGL